MRGTIHKMIIDRYKCCLYLPPEYERSKDTYPVVYMNGGEGIAEIISSLEAHFDIVCEAFILLAIQPVSWKDDYSPWPMQALAEKDESFGGAGDAYINLLCKIIKPYIDLHYRTKPERENTALVGYSLGGLAALYSLYISSTFSRIGSLSGSLWFEGWIEFISSNKLLNSDTKIYMSLGIKEEKSRNQYMSRVGDCTRKTEEMLTKQLTSSNNLILEWNNGGHFTEIPMRYQKALLWLMKIL